MRERKHFIREHLRGEHSVSELCRRFGLSRKTGHKWLGRFQPKAVRPRMFSTTGRVVLTHTLTVLGAQALPR